MKRGEEPVAGDAPRGSPKPKEYRFGRHERLEGDRCPWGPEVNLVESEGRSAGAAGAGERREIVEPLAVRVGNINAGGWHEAECKAERRRKRPATESAV